MASWIIGNAECGQVDDSKTTPPIRTAHPRSRHGPTASRKMIIPIRAPTIIDISRIGATMLSGAPWVRARRINIYESGDSAPTPIAIHQ